MRKPIPAATPLAGPEFGMRRVLGPLGLTALGVGGIIGVGIFVMAGLAARATGPALTVSFLVAAVACIATALCYAEFASSLPVAGSSYAYAYATLGELPAWLLGWNLVLCYTVAAASVASGWSHYFQDFLSLWGGHLPATVRTVPFDGESAGHLAASGSVLDLAAAGIPLVLTGLLIRGVRESASFNAVMVAVKISVILLFCVVGAFHLDPRNWVPFAPNGWGGISLGGDRAGAAGGPQPMGMLAAATLVFYAYLGFEAISAQSEEALRPRRDVSLGIVASLLVCAALYVAVSAILTGMVPYQEISTRAPLADALRRAGLPWAHVLVTVGALAGITTVLLVILLTLPRVLMAMGRDRLLPAGFFAAIHPRFGTPWKATLLAGAAVSLLAAFIPLRLLADLVTLGTLLGFIAVCGAVVVLRRCHSTGSTGFRAPFGLLTPAIAIITCLLLLLPIPIQAVRWLGLWLFAGALVYLAYGRRHSVLTRHTATAGQPLETHRQPLEQQPDRASIEGS